MSSRVPILPTLVLAAMLWPSPLDAQTADQGAEPAERPPVVNRVNEYLPAWLRLRAEIRDRVEGVMGAGFTSGLDDAYNLTRMKLDVNVRAGRLATFTTQFQHARPYGKTIGPTGAPYRDALNLHLGYAHIGDSQKERWSVRAGRQELAFGEERLVGAANWLNAPRAFDGVRLTLGRSRQRFDAFAASLVSTRGVFRDSSGHGNWLSGVYDSVNDLVPKSILQSYVLWRHDRRANTERAGLGTLSTGTIGVRWTGSLPARLDYGTEMAAQVGSIGGEPVRAWAGHWQLRRTVDTKRTTRLWGEFNYASGDGDPTDGRRGTFDQLYATAHDKLGLADQFGWRNIRHLGGAVEIAPAPSVTLVAKYHSWWLADVHDGLYGAAGGLLAAVKGGAPDAHVGQEIDGQVTWTLSPRARLVVGYANAVPGAFLVAATPGASYSYPYLALTYVLLAEK